MMTNSMLLPIWNDIYDGLNLCSRVNSAKYIVSVWPNCQALSPQNFTKSNRRFMKQEIFVLYLISRQQYLLADIKFLSKVAS